MHRGSNCISWKQRSTHYFTYLLNKVFYQHKIKLSVDCVVFVLFCTCPVYSTGKHGGFKLMTTVLECTCWRLASRQELICCFSGKYTLLLFVCISVSMCMCVFVHVHQTLHVHQKPWAMEHAPKSWRCWHRFGVQIQWAVKHRGLLCW